MTSDMMDVSEGDDRMRDEKRDARAGDEPVVESASATTSPDNAGSGNGAYVVFVVVAALLMALVSALSSCTGALSDVAWQSRSWDGAGDGSRDWGQDDGWLDFLDELELDGHETHHFMGVMRQTR